MTGAELKILLSNNASVISEILTGLQAHHIHIIEGKRIQFAFPENRGNRTHCIFLDKYLLHKDYPNGITEDFIQMVARLKNTSYQMAINYILLYTNGGMNSVDINDFKAEYVDKPLTTYNQELLDIYPKTISELFLKDGIPPTVQMKFGIRYSEDYNRILIPIFQKGEFVGLFGRWNAKEFDAHCIPKYLPILPYLKGKVLFPYDINSKYVKESKTVFLVESEKTPMLTYKWGIRNIFALGGNCVKDPQIELLKELGVEKIILCLDKGLEKDSVDFTILRLKENGFKVYNVEADSIPYLPDKECLFDLNDMDLICETLRKYIKER